jgi:acetaldehyde dehydrogenase/alcohol dehydrogenase
MNDIVKGILSSNSSDASAADMLLRQAEWAASACASFDRAGVHRIAHAAAEAGHEAATSLAELAVSETGFGVVADKRAKNQLASRGLYEYYKDADYCSARITAGNVVEIPRPAGVVLGLVPSTNPVCTTYCKILLAILTRNAIVISPHPRSRECTIRAVHAMASAAEQAGAPAGLIQVLENPDLGIIDTLMRSPRVAVTLATGGLPMVRAAYGSGNPAIGVGPGNAPAFVDQTADLPAAAARIIASKSFDNSTLCTNESVIVAERPISGALLEHLRRNDVHVASAAEVEQVRGYLFGQHGFNVDALGKPAAEIARNAGFKVPAGTRVILVPIGKVGVEEPLSREKLCPVLGFLPVEDFEEGLRQSAAMTRFSGAGHSAAIHSRDLANVVRFAATLNVLRIIVNAPCSQGAAGFATNLAPSFTVGTGYVGRSSVGDNIGPQHLVNWTRIACAKEDAAEFPAEEMAALQLEHLREPLGRCSPLTYGTLPPASAGPRATGATGEQGDFKEHIRQIVIDEIRRALKGA